MNKWTSKTFQLKLLKYIMTVRWRGKLCKDIRHLTIYSSVRKRRGAVNGSCRSGVKSSTRRCGIISPFFLQHTSYTLDTEHSDEIRLSWAVPLTKIHCENSTPRVPRSSLNELHQTTQCLVEKHLWTFWNLLFQKTTRQPALPLVSTGRLNPSGNNQVPMFSSGYQTQRGDFTSNGNIEESFQTHPLFIYSSKTWPTQRWPGHHLPLRSGHVWSITVFFFCVFFFSVSEAPQHCWRECKKNPQDRLQRLHPTTTTFSSLERQGTGSHSAG